MKKKWIVWFAFGVGIICGIAAGWKLKPVPVYKPGVQTIIDSVTVHDTVMVPGTISDKPKIVTLYKVRIDTVIKEKFIEPVQDTTPCYSIDGTSKRGTYAYAELCSKAFPVQQPIDLNGSIYIQDAPDTTRNVFSVDTVMTKVPFYKDWKTYAILTLTGILAASVTMGR